MVICTIFHVLIYILSTTSLTLRSINNTHCTRLYSAPGIITTICQSRLILLPTSSTLSPYIYLFASSHPTSHLTSHLTPTRLISILISHINTSHLTPYISHPPSRIPSHISHPNPSTSPSTIPYCLIGAIKKQLHKTSRKSGVDLPNININKIQNKRQSDTISIIEL